MFLKKFICLLLLVNSSCSLNAQNKTADSLLKLIEIAKTDTAKVNLLYQLSDFYNTARYNLDSALLYALQGLDLSKRIAYKNGEATALVNFSYLQLEQGKNDVARQSLFTALSILNKSIPKNLELEFHVYRALSNFYSEAKPDSSIYYNTKALQLAQSIQNFSQEVLVLTNMGYEFLLLGNYPQALRLCTNGEQIAEKNKDTLGEAYIYRRLGDVYFFQNDAKKAIYYFNLADSLGSKLKDENTNDLFDMIHLSKARAYLKWNILDSALVYAKQYYDVAKKTHYNIGLSRMLNTLGNIYEKMGRDSIAYNYFLQGISVSLSQHVITSAIQTYNSLAQYFYHQQNFDSCIFYAKKAVEITQSSSFLLNEPETYNILSNAYLAKRDIDSTFKYTHLMQNAKDSLLGMDKIEQMQLIVFNEQQEKKQQEAKQLAYKNTIRLYVLLAGIILLFLMAALLFRNNRNKQKAYNLLQKQKTETDLQRDKADKALAELKSTQAQLIQSEKMASLGELTAGIAHEIQNPLNFVNNFSEVNKELIDDLKTELATGNQQQAIEIADNIKENSEKINHHGKRAGDIVKGMLQHSRTSTGVKEPTDINALADEYLRLSYHGLRAKDKSFNAKMETDFDESIGKINIIPQDIGRVLLNLFNNAFYAVNEQKSKNLISFAKEVTPFEKVSPLYEPTVSVTTKKFKNSVLITVSDNGNGIPKNIVDKIFQPFFTTKPTGSGTGLGLSLSYDMVKAHGGEIKVETKEGEGSEFLIELPFSEYL